MTALASVAPAYRYDIANPREQHHRHFASGVNHPGEVRGLFGSGRWVGITAGEARTGLFDELEASSHGSACLFVDSGAFSEVEFGPAGVAVVNPIDHAGWLERFELYTRCALLFRTRCYVVAPDRIGDQQHTLALLARYAPHVASVVALRAQVIVPVQKGATSMGDFFRQQQAILGLRAATFNELGLWEGGVIAGIPMKKDATSRAELAAFVETLPVWGSRIHLLGFGPASKGYDAVIELIKSRRPNCSITSDSVTIRRLAGRTNGKGGGPRILTQEQDKARAMGMVGAEVKAYALCAQGAVERDAELDAAHAAGWFDVELFDTLEEAIAFHEASKKERT